MAPHCGLLQQKWALHRNVLTHERHLFTFNANDLAIDRTHASRGKYPRARRSQEKVRRARATLRAAFIEEKGPRREEEEPRDI